MQRALELAQMGRYTCAPNPMVGCVIVHEDEIIGEGFHYKAGEPHAEPNAIATVADKSLLASSTLYVSLEPCAHFGRTPPCSNLIIEHQIPRVVLATRDFNSEVNGKGIQRMQNAGIELIEGVLEKEAQLLNAKFFTFHQKKRPFISLKWAQSKDGIMDPAREEKQKGIQWISQPESQVYSHRLRVEHQAILVGRKTVETDNPSLDSRAFKGPDPLRIIIDPKAKLNTDLKVFRDSNYWHFKEDPKGERDRYLDSKSPLESILNTCYNEGIQSLLVEGGAKTLSHFVEQDLWDEIHIIEANHCLNSGLKAPSIKGAADQLIQLGKDQIKIYRQ